MARIGGFLCPYFITHSNDLALIGVIVLVVAVLTAECSRRLPETTGKAMGESVSAYSITNHDHHDDNVYVRNVTTQESDSIHGTQNSRSVQRGMVRREAMTLTSSTLSRTDNNNDNAAAAPDGEEPTTSALQLSLLV